MIPAAWLITSAVQDVRPGSSAKTGRAVVCSTASVTAASPPEATAAARARLMKYDRMSGSPSRSLSTVR
jgi:hypothetical protein